MTTALLAILGVALAGLLGLVQLQLRELKADIRELRTEVREMRAELGGQIGELRTEVGKLGERLDAHIKDHPPAGRRVS